MLACFLTSQPLCKSNKGWMITQYYWSSSLLPHIHIFNVAHTKWMSIKTIRPNFSVVSFSTWANILMCIFECFISLKTTKNNVIYHLIFLLTTNLIPLSVCVFYYWLTKHICSICSTESYIFQHWQPLPNQSSGLQSWHHCWNETPLTISDSCGSC